MAVDARAVDLRAGAAGGAFLSSDLEATCRRHEPHRSSHRSKLSFGAAVQTFCLSRARRRHPRRARAPMFDASSDDADAKSFAERCEDDRHHFRFIVSPEDASETGELRTFTRELMVDAERDLGTRLDWVGGRPLEHRQPARPCPGPRPRRRWPRPRHQPRLHQPGVSRPRLGARHSGTGAAHRTGNPIRAGE